MPSFSDMFLWRIKNDQTYDMCTLLRDIGDYEAGEYFESIVFDIDSLTLKFYYDDNEIKCNSPCMVKKLS